MLEVRGLAVRYGSSQVLFGIEFAVGDGELVTLMGRNGMGKTTTVRSIMGLTPAMTGSIRFDGREIRGLPAYQVAKLGIGLVPEGRQVFPNLTTRENLVATAANRSGAPEPWTLDRVCAEVGFPKSIRVDQGSEFISRDLDLWAYLYGVTLDFSRPGKPTDNAFIEAFNGKLRQECLSAHWFLTLADAREKMEAWRRFYNEDRPHSAIGYNVPIALTEPGGAAGPPP